MTEPSALEKRLGLRPFHCPECSHYLLSQNIKDGGCKVKCRYCGAVLVFGMVEGELVVEVSRPERPGGRVSTGS